MNPTAIDLFAGLGGTSTGLVDAGLRVSIAANHWPFAVAVHELNHPSTRHVQQDLHQADWTEFGQCDVLFASPACQGHSSAAQPTRSRTGVRVKHDRDRATAWAVVSCAEVCRPPALVVENVPGFARWELYDVWTQALRTLGYSLEELVIDAADYGVPQHRRRLFLLGHQSEQAARAWAAATRAQGSPERVLVRDVVDWGDGDWRPVESASQAASERILAGTRFGARHWWCQHVTHHRSHTVGRPWPTVTGADQLVVCRRSRRGVEYRPLTAVELLRSQGFASTYRLPAKFSRRDLSRAVGNAVPPRVAAAIAQAGLGCGAITSGGR